MKTFFRYARLYLLITSQYVKARLSYRADFIISSVGIVFQNVPGFLGLLVVFNNIPRLAGWDLPELVFIYGFALLAVSPLQIVFDNIWMLRWQVQNGDFIKYYFRPLNMMFYFISERVDLKGFAQLLMGIVLVVWSSLALHLVWTVPRLLGLVALLLCGSLVMVGLMVMAASTAFWIVNSFSILALINRFREYARYPLSIFDGVFRFLFTTLIPIGFIAFYPVQWALRPEEAGIAVYFTPLVGIGLFALGYLVWAKGVRRWSGTGT
jgi:ABC-2 type transport system permease protein